MPDLYQWVLVCDTPKGSGEPRCINIWRWNGEDWERTGNDDIDCPTFTDIWSFMGIFDVTHWMSLPLPPEDL